MVASGNQSGAVSGKSIKVLGKDQNQQKKQGGIYLIADPDSFVVCG